MVDSMATDREQRIVSQFVHLLGRHSIALILQDAGRYEFFQSR